MTLKLSKIISYTLHPVVFPIIGTLLYFIFLPHHIESSIKNRLIMYVFVVSYIMPVFFMFLLKRLKLIENYRIETIDERRFPLLFLTVLSYSLSILLYRSTLVPELAVFFFGTTLTLSIAYFMIYINFKVSLHTIGFGGVIGFLALISYAFRLNLIIVLSLGFVIAGYIASARLNLKAHTEKEVYFGFLIGVLSQCLVYIALL